MRISWPAVACATVLLTLAYALPFAAHNQATYLLDALHRAEPELFRRDWLVSETPSYMPVFGWLAQWLFRIDGDGALAVLVAHVIVSVATYIAVHWFVRAVSPHWQTSVIVISLVAATRNVSMAGSYLIAGYLQPSALATLGWIIAMAALVRGRYLLCGLALACAGALHANFLVLGVGLFALVALARRARWRDLALLLGPQLVVLACFAPQLYAAAGPSDEALRILVDFHAPYHYSPRLFVRAVPIVLAWQVAAAIALYFAGTMTRELRALWLFSLIACAITTTSALLMAYAGLESLTQLFWARIAPFGQLACEVLIVSVVIRHVHARTRIGVTALALFALAFALWRSPRGSGLTTTPYAYRSEIALTTWVREQTPIDALFLVPPGFGKFRLLARRAVVADIKSPPLRPDLLVAWYRRLCAASGASRARTKSELNELYARRTLVELTAIAHAFGAEYIVARPGLGEPLFVNADYAVYRAL